MNRIWGRLLSPLNKLHTHWNENIIKKKAKTQLTSLRTSWRQMKRIGEDQMIRWEDINKWPSSRTNWRKMKRMGWDDQMRAFQSIDQVHVPTGDGWRGWMGWSDERSSNNWPSSHTFWRQMEKMGWDDHMRGLRTINQIHVLSGDGWRRQNGTIRWEVFK